MSFIETHTIDLCMLTCMYAYIGKAPILVQETIKPVKYYLLFFGQTYSYIPLHSSQL